jgi:segregation and condensation protein B
MTECEIKNVIEAALLAAGKSLTLAELGAVFEEAERPTTAMLRAALAALAADYAERPIELCETGAGFRVQVRGAYAATVARLWPERPQRYSRALLETLALIAYRQPITRAEIEAVRGVAVSPNIIRTLHERQWVRVVGHRDLPGRPELLSTTREFLEYFGLLSLDELPPLAELRSLGELDPQLDLVAVDPGIEALAPDALTQERVGAILSGQSGGLGEVSRRNETASEEELSDGEPNEGEACAGDSAPGLVAAPPGP